MKLITAVLALAIAAAPTVRAEPPELCSARQCEVEGNGVGCACDTLGDTTTECFNGQEKNPGCWHFNGGKDVSCECIPKEAICDGEPGGLEQISASDSVVVGDVCITFGDEFTDLAPTDGPTEKPTQGPTRLRPTNKPKPNPKPSKSPTPAPTTSPTPQTPCNTDCETNLGGEWVFNVDGSQTCSQACGGNAFCSAEGTNSIFVQGDEYQSSRNLKCVVEEYLNETCEGYTFITATSSNGVAVAPSAYGDPNNNGRKCWVPTDATARCNSKPAFASGFLSVACCCVLI